MKKYTYLPPRFKPSSKIVDVIDAQGNVVCKFKRTYKNFLTRLVYYVTNIDWYVQIDVISNDRDIVYQCQKTTKLVGRPEYQVINCMTNEMFQVCQKSWQNIVPEFHIKYNSIDLVMKNELLDWVRIFHNGEEVARWKMKTSEWFKTHLEIEEDCPIQEPEFFVCLLQNIFCVGD
ncbi:MULTISPECIES: hypothetical protein [unclassified Bacillus (in: firmicutes)]|uniref:tubby C-terminal domain-like protein n=1 Tax=unclassified Bacillus (in: firmicutes) TaxID=185979 RepID=UPI0008F30A1E|nr:MULTISPECIES: hypothetical protein [unclassified Bacillus (in: firmicutes)]SFA71014.1 hypothetical protein SAMN02799634_101169 [Bacillus sp. UNCCL13]SFQ61057.1 hypothetical protein SAMN04488577_0454 [Bacillus sp. cl95]